MVRIADYSTVPKNENFLTRLVDTFISPFYVGNVSFFYPLSHSSHVSYQKDDYLSTRRGPWASMSAATYAYTCIYIYIY